MLYECFQYYDKSGNGVIDRDELPEALRFAGINPSETDLDYIIKLFDTNGTKFALSCTSTNFASERTTKMSKNKLFHVAVLQFW